MTVRELRDKYLRFFESKGHSIYPSGSLVPIDVTEKLDESLLFNGAGMVQFKPYFRGIATPPNRRLTTAQKCLRTGDIDEVGDQSHLTFFEMLGNFSFGDYFKTEAIAFSWEFLTSPEWLAIDKSRLAFTVFSEDDEAYNLWLGHLAAAGIDGTNRVFKLGEKTNYWPAESFTNGPPGPCGPNSEMFYWVPNDIPPPNGEYTAEDYLKDESEGKWLEIWNDVFISYEWQGDALPEGGYKKTGMPNLPFLSVDTGMGLERTAAVLSGHSSVYDTDAFTGILSEIRHLVKDQPQGSEAAGTQAMRIVADHLRSTCFCIADGILPSNSGRGYVLRRLIRRAILKGSRVLGFSGPFLNQLVDSVIQTMGDHYRELVERREVIVETLKNEENLFLRTLASGSEILNNKLEDWRQGRKTASSPLQGDIAFMLYDTYGFPLEVTEELCREAGVTVDHAGYKDAMAAAQERSRGASGMESVYGGVTLQINFVGAGFKPTPTLFSGYDRTRDVAKVTGVIPVPSETGWATDEFVLSLDRTPFYAESGGQVSDSGILRLKDLELEVNDVRKQDGVFVHVVTGVPGLAGLSLEHASGELAERLFNQQVECLVDSERRKHITRHHTVTHLAHSALRQVLGPHVSQAGSLVSDDLMRFDFTHGSAMTPDEIFQVEEEVNRQILAAHPVKIYTDVPLEEARQMGAMALFGEKYADHVRVVQIGGMSPTEPSFSRELCGGIHVSNTGEVGTFKILSEASAASGVRRITCLAGWRTIEWLHQQMNQMVEASQLLKSNPRELVSAVHRTLDALKEERRKREKLASQGSGQKAEIIPLGTVELTIERLNDGEPEDAKRSADRLTDNQPNRVALVALKSGEKVTFVCKVGAEAQQAGAHAGNIVKQVAQVAGGGGGGRPDFATAGGRDASKLDEALAKGVDVLKEMVKA
ncbi:MAG: alanine--tRNA ligase [Fimbriimonadaceae bacterium]|jgi:alanyl-tRNA synthetase|nr:alanine--tRNA ligase [Fimbriimonadaceae bacterium]